MDESLARYERDPEFNALVRLLEDFARQKGYTPYELKQAAWCASMRVEMTASRPLRIPSRERGS